MLFAGARVLVQSAAENFAEHQQRLRVEIDAALVCCAQYGGDCPQQLAEAIRHSLLAPGKRLRPQLVLMAAEACGCDYQRAMPAACAVEMVHTYSLIHDDLPAMDDDEMRRGRPTCHVVFGEAMAILAGDALLAQAFETLATGIEPAAVAGRCCAELAFAAGPAMLVGGQVDDIAAEKHGGGLSDLERIHRRKTGAMIRVSLRLGGVIGGADEEQLAALGEYGEKLGLAFQIVDDWLDVRGEEAAMGKRLRKDSEHGKLTFPRLLGAEESRRRAESLVAAACERISGFGPRASTLEALARYVLERNH